MSYELKDTNDLFIQTLVERWMELNSDVESYDEKMDVESYGKTKLLNKIFNDVGGLDSDKNVLANSVRNFMSSENVDTEEKFVGFYETLRRIIKEWDDRVDKFVKDNTSTVPDSEKPTPEQIEDMRKDRKTAVDAMNGIRGLLEGTAPDWFKTEGNDLLPTKINKRGAVGGREKLGPRLAKYQYRVNGTILSDNKLSAIVQFLKGKVSSVKEIREAINAQIPGFDWENSPNEFEFNIAGAHVQAEKLVDDSPEEDDSSDEDNSDIVTETADQNEPLFFDDDEDNS